MQVTIKKNRPAANGFGDRGAVRRRAGTYVAVDEDGRVRAEIERTSDPSYGDSPEWRVVTFDEEGTRRYSAYRRTLAEAKAKALDLVAALDAEMA